MDLGNFLSDEDRLQLEQLKNFEIGPGPAPVTDQGQASRWPSPDAVQSVLSAGQPKPAPQVAPKPKQQDEIRSVPIPPRPAPTVSTKPSPLPAPPSVQPVANALSDATQARAEELKGAISRMGAVPEEPIPASKAEIVNRLSQLNGRDEGTDIFRGQLLSAYGQIDAQERAKDVADAQAAYAHRNSLVTEQRVAEERAYQGYLKDGQEKKAKWENSLANAEVGMSGTDWAIFIGLSLLRAVGAAATGAQQDGNGLFRTFIDKWVENRVTTKEKQIELYQRGLTNARNDLLDMRNDFGDRMQALEAQRGILSGQLASELAAIGAKYPGTAMNTQRAILELNAKRRDHDAKWGAYREEGAKNQLMQAKTNYDLKLQDFDNRLKLYQLAQQSNASRATTPELDKAHRDMSARMSLLHSAESAPKEYRKDIAKQFGIDVTGIKISDDPQWTGLIRLLKKAEQDKFSAQFGGTASGGIPLSNPTLDQQKDR